MMIERLVKLNVLLITFLIFVEAKKGDLVSPQATLIYGHGLKPDEVVLPARYFFIHAVTTEGVL